MREYLFRGKKIDNGKQKGQFVYGGYTEWGNTQSVITEKGKYGENHAHEVDPDTVGQYTNVNDKCGKRIFEGDRVRVPMYPALGGKLLLMEGTVEWENGAFHVTWDDKDKGRHFVGYLQDVEVIGNIYDGIG